MRNIGLFIFCLIITCSCKNSNEREVVKKYYSNGNLKSEYQVVQDSIKDGYWKTYYEDGILKGEGTFKNNEWHGNLTLYYSSGQIKSKLNFINGQYHGKWIDWYESGKIESVLSYVNGCRDGESIYYYNTGKLEGKHLYHQDTIYRSIFYDRNGVILAEGYKATFISSPDTLYLGDTIKVRTVLNNLSGNIYAITIPYKDKYKSNDTMKVYSFNGSFEYKFIPQSSGKYWTLLQLKLTDTTFKTRWNNFDTVFYVLPKR